MANRKLSPAMDLGGDADVDLNLFAELVPFRRGVDPPELWVKP